MTVDISIVPNIISHSPMLLLIILGTYVLYQWRRDNNSLVRAIERMEQEQQREMERQQREIDKLHREYIKRIRRYYRNGDVPDLTLLAEQWPEGEGEPLDLTSITANDLPKCKFTTEGGFEKIERVDN